MEQAWRGCLKACGPLGHVGSNPTPGATVTPTVFSGLFAFSEDFPSSISVRYLNPASSLLLLSRSLSKHIYCFVEHY